MADNMKSIATKMTIGLILILLWIPAIMKSWIFRIISGLLLGVGVFLISAPIKHILENAPNLVDFPIIRVLKPILEAGSGAILFFINSFSFIGSGILAILMTLFVFLLVNFAIPIIIIIIGFVVWQYFKNKNKSIDDF